MNELIMLGVDEDDITHVSVPGALEIPLALAKLAATEDFDALIALGCVIRGETYHFEVVANESARGAAQVSLTMAFRSPTPSSRPRTTSRRAHGSRKKAAMPRVLRSKWRTCCWRWTKMAHPLPPAKNKTDLQPSSPPDGAARAIRASKGSSRSARRRARELALQGLYQWLIAGRDAASIDRRSRSTTAKRDAGADVAHYRELLNGAIEHADDLRARIRPASGSRHQRTVARRARDPADRNV